MWILLPTEIRLLIVDEVLQDIRLQTDRDYARKLTDRKSIPICQEASRLSLVSVEFSQWIRSHRFAAVVVRNRVEAKRFAELMGSHKAGRLSCSGLVQRLRLHISETVRVEEEHEIECFEVMLISYR